MKLQNKNIVTHALILLRFLKSHKVVKMNKNKKLIKKLV